jgi:hypothetical protein
MKLKKREEQIVLMREQGFPYSKIAAQFKISNSRARQIFLLFQKEKALCTKWPFYALLSNRARNSLKNRFGGQVFSNPKIVYETGRKKICETKNIGKYAIREIDAALIKLGFIKKGQEW